MREQLNNNPAVQLGILAVLLLAGGFFLITRMGGGSEEASGGEATTTATSSTVPGAASEAVEGGETLETGTAAAPAPTGPVTPPSVPPPTAVVRAWESGATVVLLFVRDGGIDDDLVRETTESLSGFSNATTFVVSAKQIARYAAVAGGVGVEQVPALVVLSPRSASGGVPTASVHYGFQSRESVEQAVIDAGYKGPTLEYHP